MFHRLRVPGLSSPTETAVDSFIFELLLQMSTLSFSETMLSFKRSTESLSNYGHDISCSVATSLYIVVVYMLAQLPVYLTGILPGVAFRQFLANFSLVHFTCYL